MKSAAASANFFWLAYAAPRATSASTCDGVTPSTCRKGKRCQSQRRCIRKRSSTNLIITFYGVLEIVLSRIVRYRSRYPTIEKVSRLSILCFSSRIASLIIHLIGPLSVLHIAKLFPRVTLWVKTHWPARQQTARLGRRRRQNDAHRVLVSLFSPPRESTRTASEVRHTSYQKRHLRQYFDSAAHFHCIDKHEVRRMTSEWWRHSSSTWMGFRTLRRWNSPIRMGSYLSPRGEERERYVWDSEKGIAISILFSFPMPFIFFTLYCSLASFPSLSLCVITSVIFCSRAGTRLVRKLTVPHAAAPFSLAGLSIERICRRESEKETN